jgi:hypothetical protein
VDLCVDFEAHVGIASGTMLLLNAGEDADDSDVVLYGPLFDQACSLANRAAELKVPAGDNPTDSLANWTRGSN